MMNIPGLPGAGGGGLPGLPGLGGKDGAGGGLEDLLNPAKMLEKIHKDIMGLLQQILGGGQQGGAQGAQGGGGAQGAGGAQNAGGSGEPSATDPEKLAELMKKLRDLEQQQPGAIEALCKQNPQLAGLLKAMTGGGTSGGMVASAGVGGGRR